MAIKSIVQNNITWHYLTDFGGTELEFLKKNYKFHPLDLKDCGGEFQRSKIDIYKNYIFMVLQLPEYSSTSNRIVVQQIYLFIGKDYLVTVNHEKTKFLNALFYKIANNSKLKDNIFSQGSEYLLYTVMDYILRQRWKIITTLDSKIEKIENDIEEGRGKKVVYEVATLRKTILQFKTILDPQRLVTNALSRIDVKFLRKDMTVYFDDIDDYADKISFLIESYRDRILSLHEINESLLSFRTNRLISLLTLFSVALMPLTLLSGIYGMNIDLPFSDKPGLVWFLFTILGGGVVLTYLSLKRKDLI